MTSVKLSENTLKKYYPEYYIYHAPTICYNINKVYLNKDNLKSEFKYLENENEIKKEIKKIKLLQILSENEYEDIVLSKINTSIIKAVGLLCEGKLFLRGKTYAQNSILDEYKIKSINMKNASLSLRKR